MISGGTSAYEPSRQPVELVTVLAMIGIAMENIQGEESGKNDINRGLGHIESETACVPHVYVLSLSDSQRGRGGWQNMSSPKTKADDTSLIY
jgi:hypothetical protein